MKNLLALDQASHTTGWAYFQDGALKEYGKFDATQYEVGARLAAVRDFVSQLIEKYNIDQVVMEDIQYQNNVANNVVVFKTLAWVQGVLITLCRDRKLPYELVLAASWKHTLGIKGRTRADQKRNAANHVLTTHDIKVPQDVADAICIGEHYIYQNRNNWS